MVETKWMRVTYSDWWRPWRLYIEVHAFVDNGVTAMTACGATFYGESRYPAFKADTRCAECAYVRGMEHETPTEPSIEGDGNEKTICRDG